MFIKIKIDLIQYPLHQWALIFSLKKIVFPCFSLRGGRGLISCVDCSAPHPQFRRLRFIIRCANLHFFHFYFNFIYNFLFYSYDCVYCPVYLFTVLFSYFVLAYFLHNFYIRKKKKKVIKITKLKKKKFGKIDTIKKKN